MPTTSSAPTSPPGRAPYRLVPEVPAVEDYLRLRRESGLTPKTREQAELALPGGWAAAHVVAEATGETVGMARVIGDGGWYFHVVDMAVLPAHQRRGLGDLLLGHLLELVRTSVPPGAYVTLMADAPGRRLYERHGFADPSPRTVGMSLLT